MMKKLFLISILLGIGLVNLKAQNIQLLMSPNPSPYISDWQEKTETATLIISNMSAGDISVKIKSELFDGKGSLVANTDASKMMVLMVPPGVNQYHAEDIFPSNAVSYKGSLQISTVKTGRIPDDTYKFCVSLTDPQTGNPIGTSGTVCKLFSILAIQAPVLINPREGEAIPETGIKGIVFRWSPVTPAPKFIVTYRLQVWEVLDGQNNNTALRSNQSIVEKDFKGALQTQWPIDFAMPEAGRKYVWTITPLDDQERKLVDGNGFAQPFGFEIGLPISMNQSVKLSLISPANNSELEPLMPVKFVWKSSSEKPTDKVTYRLKVWQLMSGQSAQTAMKTNAPVVTKDFDNTTEATISNIYTGPCHPPFLCDFVWTIEIPNTLSSSSQAKSEAFQFHFMEEKTTSVVLGSPSNNLELETGHAISFMWFPLNPKPKTSINYRLKVWQLMQGQSASQAIVSNKPIFEKDFQDILIDMKDQTMKATIDIETGPCKPPYLCEFVWSVAPIIDVSSGANSGTTLYVFKIKNPDSSPFKALVPRGVIEAGPFEEITFRWTPIVPKPQEPVTYRLRVWQLMQGQSSTSAMLTNQPIVTKEVDNITQASISNIYTGPCRPPYLCDYVWSVQAISKSGTQISNGLSEAGEFKFAEGKASITLESPKISEQLDPLKEITFRWTPIEPKPSEPVTYRLRVWQLMQGQNSMDAMRTNQPIIKKDVDNNTQATILNIYTGPCRPPYLCEYVWNVQAINKSGSPIANGLSESSEFTLDENKLVTGFGWGIKFGKKALSSCDGFGICDIIISSANLKPDAGVGIGTLTSKNKNNLQIAFNKQNGLNPETYQKLFSKGYFLFEDDYLIPSEVSKKLKLVDQPIIKKGSYKVQDNNGILIIDLEVATHYNNLETAELDLKKKKGELDSLRKEQEGIGKKIRDTTVALRDCDEQLKKAEAELAAANAELQKQKDINKNIENNTGPGKYWPDNEAARKAHGDYEQKLKDAQKVADEAQAKVNKLKKRCPELTKALELLKSISASLPGDISRGEKAVSDAEKRRDDIIKESEKCKEGEIRDAPGKSATSTTYVCATGDTKVSTNISTNLDGTLSASKDFSDYIKIGLVVLKKVPVIGKMVKIASLPAKMGADILAAIPNSGALSRIGLESVNVEITIGPLHKFTLTKSDLEICKNGKWVPYDKKKCVLKDEGEVPSTVITHNWKIGGVAGSDLSELTSAGTGFKEALAAAIEKLITDAVTPPEKLEDAMKDSQ